MIANFQNELFVIPEIFVYKHSIVENTERFWANESNFEIPVQKIDQLVYESHYD